MMVIDWKEIYDCTKWDDFIQVWKDTANRLVFYQELHEREYTIAAVTFNSSRLIHPFMSRQKAEALLEADKTKVIPRLVPPIFSTFQVELATSQHYYVIKMEWFQE